MSAQILTKIFTPSFADTPASTAPLSAAGKRVYLLHGFPGRRTHQSQDLAAWIAEKWGYTAVVLFYPGLGVAPGAFGFTACREWVLDFFRNEAKTNKKMALLGHSFGGYLSLQVAAEMPGAVSSLALLSPLIDFTRAGLSQAAMEQVYRDYSDMRFLDIHHLKDDFQDLGRNHPTKIAIESLSAELSVQVIQSANDTITRPEYMREALKWFVKQPDYVELALDHSFLEDRELLFRTLKVMQ